MDSGYSEPVLPVPLDSTITGVDCNPILYSFLPISFTGSKHFSDYSIKFYLSGSVRVQIDDVILTDYYKQKVAYMGKTVLEVKLTQLGVLCTSLDFTSWHADYKHQVGCWVCFSINTFTPYISIFPKFPIIIDR